MRVVSLRCEYLVNPLGIDVPRPRLQWLLASDVPGDRQTAWQVVVDGLWDSGKVDGPHPASVEYGGPPLAAGQRATWRARVWDAVGEASPWSDDAWWEVGRAPQGSWISAVFSSVSVDGVEPWTGGPCGFVRQDFSLDAGVRRARAYATAGGLYELFVNGRRVGDAVFAPGWTDYRSRIEYQSYDVTELLRAGDNAVGMVLADGWWCGKLAWTEGKRYGERPMGLLELVVELEDGSVEYLSTDESWRAAAGPYLYSDMQMGEAFDARRRLDGWSEPGFDDSAWTPVTVEAAPGGVVLEGVRTEPVRRTEELAAVDVAEVQPGVFVFDLGQNMVGRVRLRVQGEAGTVVRLRHAEMLDADGGIYTQNLRGAGAADFYVLAGHADGEVWEPSFTFHGFRYVEVTGFPGTPGLDALTGVVLGSDLEQTGEFACSNETVNQLQRNIVWGQRGNFLEVPTDCPQRDERMGWLGDAQVFAPTACWNYDVAGFLARWLQMVEDGQRDDGYYIDVAPALPGFDMPSAPAWADAGVIVPWTVYRHYGDVRVLAQSYDSAKRFVDALDRDNPSRIRRTPGRVPLPSGDEYGDWLAIEATTPKDVLATSYFAESARLLSQMAEVLGHDDDAKRYRALWEDVRRAFIEAFVTPTGRVVGHTQTSYVLALMFDLLPEEHRAAAAQYLVDDIERKADHLSTGFVGVGLLLPALSAVGRVDVAYRLLLQDTFPSWLYSIKHGATTIWERWDGWTEVAGFQTWHMNSFNHYSLGSVGAWLSSDVAGLALDESVPGYGRAVIRPRPGGGLTWARGALRSVHGRFEVAWRIEEGEFVLEATVPVGAEAAVVLPSGASSVVGSGRHEFRCQWDEPEASEVSA